MKKTVLSVFVLASAGLLGCLPLAACPTVIKVASSSTVPDVKLLEGAFQRWEEGVESELKAGISFIHGGIEKEYLASQVVREPGFFLKKLEKNMFVVIILDASELRKKHEDQLAGKHGLQDGFQRTKGLFR